MSLKHFLRWFVSGLSCTLCLCWALVFVVDPYDAFASSPHWGRGDGRLRMVGGWAQEMRFVVPSLARKSQFDSALIGNSTCQVISPATLGRELGGSFVNLCMGGSPFSEQVAALHAFLRHHHAPKTIFWAIYPDMCGGNNPYRRHPLVPFPDLLYVGGLGNLHLLLNWEAVRQAALQVAITLRLDTRTSLPPVSLPSSYYESGDWNLYATNFDLSPAAVQKRIYSVAGTAVSRALSIPLERPFSVVDEFEATLREIPAATKKVIFLIPLHAHGQPEPSSLGAQRLDLCKRTVNSLISRTDNAVFVDFLLVSPFTKNDANFVDAYHTVRPATDELITMTAKALRDGRGDCVNYDVGNACATAAAK